MDVNEALKNILMVMKRSVLREAGYDSAIIDNELIASVEATGNLTINQGRDGSAYLWYRDNDGTHEACVCIETGDFITKEKIEELLACSD